MFFESTFTFGTFKLFFTKKKFACLQIGPQMARNNGSIKTGLIGKIQGFSATNRTSYTYKKKVRCTFSPESIYFTHFAMRYPVQKFARYPKI